MRFLILTIAIAFCFVLYSEARDEKAFSLFSVVQFDNKPCQSQSGSNSRSIGINRNGTCYTATECGNKGGTSSGNCASGFGVCCIFIISNTTSTTAKENNTYIQNPSFPSVYTSTSSITYKVEKMKKGICAFRLDFDIFFIEAPTSTVESTASGGKCEDTFKLTTTTSYNSPSICGQNAGQHMYMNVGPASGVTMNMAFTFSTTTTTTRKWEIKVSQYECKDYNLPPAGCLQYFMGHSGTWKTFNFDASSTSNRIHMQALDYSVCFRPEAGACCIRYQPCASEADSWTLNEDDVATKSAHQTGEDCTEDYIGIAGASSTCSKASGNSLTSRICGRYWSADTQGKTLGTTYETSTTKASALKICDCSAPFTIEVHTDSTGGTNAASAGDNRGVCLDYEQIPCH